MNPALSTASVVALLKSPFQGQGWQSRLGILVGISLASLIIPLLPGLWVAGYLGEVIRQTREGGETDLPEWKELGQLGLDGLRLNVVSFLMFAPILFLFVIGFGVYIAGIMQTVLASENPAISESRAVIGSLVGVGFLFLSIGAVSFLSLILSFVCGPALAHVAVRRKIGAFFAVSEWFALLKANFGGFFLVVVILFGLGGILELLLTGLYMTVILIPLIFVLLVVFMPVVGVMVARLLGVAYREAEEKMNAHAAKAE